MDEPRVFNPRQLLFQEVFVGTFIYVAVLGFVDDYTSLVDTRSFRFLFGAAIVLEALTVLTFKAKDVIVGRLRGRGTRRATALMGLGVWFVMFSSKFVFVWSIDLVFRDDVTIDGFVGVLAVVIPVTVVHRLAEWMFVSLGRSATGGTP